MKKLISNWIFTLVETILLLAFSVLVFIFGGTHLNVLVGAALIVYIALVILSKVVVYRGIIQMIAMLEFFVITILAIFVIVDFPLMPGVDIVNLTFGVTMWFRATTEILHSYHGQGEGRAVKKVFTAWKIFFYILLLTVGTFIASTSLLAEQLVQYLIAGIAIAGTVIMAALTYTNYRDYREIHPRPIKPKKVKKPKNELPEAENNAKALPAGKDDKLEAPAEVVEEEVIVEPAGEEKLLEAPVTEEAEPVAEEITENTTENE